MKTVAIISEYNPFHNGHAYLIKRAREAFGEDTAVIAIMSGNFTQRGELAIADKTVRARAALECGADLVVEIPFPFSVSSAEFYAKSGVKIADSLGIVDYLVFGSECADVSLLIRVAENMRTKKYAEAIRGAIDDEKYRAVGYPALSERIYRELFGDSMGVLSSPNNTLALEYIKAILDFKSSIIPVTFKRMGAGFLDGFDSDMEFQSASALRKIMREGSDLYKEYMPREAVSAYENAKEKGLYPADSTRLDAAVIAHLRLNPSAPTDIHDAAGGLYNRLCDGARKASNIDSLIEHSETKKYTSARIMRAVWYSYFGVTSSEIRCLPRYTQLLAANEVGRALLRRVSKESEFPVITKPSAKDGLGEVAVRQKERADAADAVYMLSLGATARQDHPFTFTPFVKK